MVEILELVVILILICAVITMPIVLYAIDDYADKKQSEELKRERDLQYIKEDIQRMEKDIHDLKMAELRNLFIDKE